MPTTSPLFLITSIYYTIAILSFFIVINVGHFFKIMGNYASACTFMIIPTTKSNMKAARVIFPSGDIRYFQDQSVKAAEIMMEAPGFFLVNSCSLNINRCFSPLSADEDLEAGNVYIMFPMRRVKSVVTPADMAVFWMAGGKRISGKEVASTGCCGGGVEVVEQPRVALEVAGLGCRIAVCRSKKPLLDTIIEESGCVR